MLEAPLNEPRYSHLTCDNVVVGFVQELVQLPNASFVVVALVDVELDGGLSLTVLVVLMLTVSQRGIAKRNDLFGRQIHSISR